MTDRLDRDLAGLSTALVFPPAPDVRDRVMAEISAAPRRGWSLRAAPRALVLALLALVLVAAITAAAVSVIPGLRLLFVSDVPSPTANPVVARLALGEAVSGDALGDRVPFAVRLPPALGKPDEVYLGGAGDVVTLVYHADERLPSIDASGVGLLVQQIGGLLDGARVEKLVDEVHADVTPLEVDGAPGYWISGPPHVVRFTDATGNVERGEMTRLVGDTLVWERDGVLYRIESSLGLDATMAIAESIAE